MAQMVQTCTAPGQNPATAFPVCGTSVFHQTTVPLCGNRAIPVSGCGNDYGDRNPFWYTFTCYQSGTLGFLISPNNMRDDYDWQLFDITGHNPDEVYTNASLFVTANWAGTYGNTGTSDNGVNFTQCGSDPAEQKNTFAKMPQLTAGHIYLLLISHFTNSQSGYDLIFSGGTAVINDPELPHLKTVEASCADQLRVKLSKNVNCNSIAGDGSDFTISATGITVTGSTGVNCTFKFDTDSLLLQLSAPLPPGTYTLGVRKGTDGNTLLDYCNNSLPDTETLHLVIVEKQPTKMDSLLPVTCAPQQVTLIFQKAIRCASIAADGSNFAVSGTYPVQVVAASGNACADGVSKEVILKFSKSLQESGNVTITLQKDFDGNTILDECGEETLAGSSLSFSVKDTVNADFSYVIKYGCKQDSIAVFHDVANGITSWNWDLDDGQKITTPNAQGIYTVFEEKSITLAVSNGFCNDTATQAVLLDNYLKADFTTIEDLCPQEPVQFTGTPQGKITTHLWEFGEGGTANTQSPAYTFAVPDRMRTLNVRYTVSNSYGCKSTATKPVTLYTSCYLAVPNAFTPNGDGLNDFLAPLNAVKATDLEFRVYNRWGQLLYSATNWKQGWDGTFKGQLQPTATYVWMLVYTNRDTGIKQQLKGTAVLIR